MIPDERVTYENGDVSLEVDHFNEGDDVYWLKEGVAAIQLNKDQLADMTELLVEWQKESRRNYPIGLRLIAAVVLLMIVVLFVVALTC